MIAVQFRKSIPRYLTLRTIGCRWPALYTGAAAMISLRELPEPKLPSPEWLRLRPILSGICGSDLATICAKGSAYLSPLTSTPFVIGHEVVGRVTQVGASADGLVVGDRVVLQPALGCRVRGIAPPCAACAAGHLALCRNVTRGNISAGIQTGYCRDTGGAWSESLVAHASQLYKVPDALSDEIAVLVEPFACALHGVLRAGSLKAQHSALTIVLVVGCGSIGLLTIAALRALSLPVRIVALAKYPHQREHAQALGADKVLPYRGRIRERYADIAAALDAELHHPEIGKPTVMGGADVTFDCVASSTSIDDCLRFTAAGGEMVLVGMPGIPSGVDWTTIWFKELTVHAAYAYGQEQVTRARSTFELSLELLCEHGARLRPLVGEPFELRDYRRAVDTALHAGASRSVKTVFRV